MNWYVAPVLARFRQSINRRWPKRDRKSDGSVGDRAHQKRVSRHNPAKDSRPPGAVRAVDTDKDGIHVPTVIAGALLHPATGNVIYNRRIMNRARKFRPAKYTGPNPHTGHVHTDILPGTDRATAAYPFLDFTPDWRIGVKHGARGERARQVQAMLIAHGYTITLDGDFGDATDKALRRFQSRKGLKADGIAGVRTLAKMMGR